VQHLSFFYLTFNMMRPFLIVWLLPRRSFATFQPPVEKVWRAQWNSMRAMVAELDPPPPVVKFGAESLASFNGAIEREFRFQALVATMLSPQTRDAQVALAIERLCAVSPTGNLLPSLVATWDVNTVEGAIRSVSFYKRKSRHLIEAATHCASMFDDDIPANLDDLLKFSGVGPKVGLLTMTIARNQTLGICVDTHVHRISNRLGWADNALAGKGSPEQTRAQLESWVPQVCSLSIVHIHARVCVHAHTGIWRVFSLSPR
jgi:endonuclease-3